MRADGRWLKLGSAAFCGLEPAALDNEIDASVHLVDERGWLASFELQERLREDARQAVETLKGLGIETWLLSGDRDAAAQRVGQAVGVDHVIAGASPEQKLAEVTSLAGAWLAPGHGG